MSSRHLPLHVCRIFFRRFGMSWFVCIVLPFLDIFLIFLLSPELSGLFPQVVLSFFSRIAFFFLSQRVPAFSLCFIIFACCRFLICISCPISHPGFDFLFVFFKGTTIFYELISLLHWLVHSIRRCFPLRYMLILHSFFLFPPWLFSGLCFLVMVRLSFFHS